VTRFLYRGAALADGTGPDLVRDVSVLVEDGRLLGLWTDGERPDAAGARVVDASGATLLPGLVDSHNHVTMPGGADWVRRGLDPAEELEAVAEESGELLLRSGVHWVRDVGSPRHRGRAVSLGVRDRWRGRPDRPVVRAAGTWLARRGRLPEGLAIALDDGDDLVTAARQQLDEGADLVKLYLDPPVAGQGPAFGVGEVRAVVELCRSRGATVAAHGTDAEGARVAAEAGVDSLEHGDAVDAEVAALLARQGTVLVSTLSVWHSILGFAATTTDPRWAARDAVAARLAQAQASLRTALQAGVVFAAGSDAGGGSCRHGSSLAWEVAAMVEAGVPAWQAVAAATWRGGDLLRDPRAGRLVVGEPARALLVHGDPYSDPTALWRVWKVL
jgi:imidazolonepropionase-like amidohydrolase